MKSIVADYLEQNLRSLTIGGRLLVIGLMGRSNATGSRSWLMVRRQRIIGSVLRPRPADEKAASVERLARRVMPLFAQGRIAPVVDRIFPPAESAAAHRHIEAVAHFGKIALTVGGQGR